MSMRTRQRVYLLLGFLQLERNAAIHVVNPLIADPGVHLLHAEWPTVSII